MLYESAGKSWNWRLLPWIINLLIKKKKSFPLIKKSSGDSPSLQKSCKHAYFAIRTFSKNIYIYIFFWRHRSHVWNENRLLRKSLWCKMVCVCARVCDVDLVPADSHLWYIITFIKTYKTKTGNLFQRFWHGGAVRGRPPVSLQAGTSCLTHSRSSCLRQTEALSARVQLSPVARGRWGWIGFEWGRLLLLILPSTRRTR